MYNELYVLPLITVKVYNYFFTMPLYCKLRTNLFFIKYVKRD